MSFQVVHGAILRCPFALPPGVTSLIVLPSNRLLTSGVPQATILDHKALLNIPSFGMCSSPSNPGVIAALGSPVPCLPITPAPWVPGSPTVLLTNIPQLNDCSCCTCMNGGVISIAYAGQSTVQIP
ncbi:hypothetical protein D3C75_948430 [compost metagenome]